MIGAAFHRELALGGRRRCRAARRARRSSSRTTNRGIASLEARIAQLESTAAAAPAASAPDPYAEQAAAEPAPTARSGATAFNPAMSAILGGSYASLSEDPADYRIAGFLPAGDEIGPGDRSFNLGESEVTLSANIDPYFMGSVTFAMTPEDELEVEEAFFRTLGLPSGLTLKADGSSPGSDI